MNRNYKNILGLFFCFLLMFPLAWGQSGKWKLMIKSDTEEWITARISFENVEGEICLNVENAEEVNQFKPYQIKGDTLFYRFIDYNAEIAFSKINEEELTGYWINFENAAAKKREIKALKLSPVEIPAENQYGKIANLEGKWKMTFQLPTRSYNGILEIQQMGSVLYGNIRTNSGDYQYLEGEVEGNNFYLSSFKGNSAFYLKGEINNHKITAGILTPVSNNVKVIAEKDAEFELVDPKKATNIINDKSFQLDLIDEKGKQHSFEELAKDKVTIVSVFGTWCPNCVDEINYFQQLKNKFPDLQIISVAFESTKEPEEQKRRVAGFKQRKEIDLLFLIGGNTDKDNILEKFPMVDNISAFPTSFLMDKKGEIKEIHTGFNGPATGILFEQYKEALETKIIGLLKE